MIDTISGAKASAVIYSLMYQRLQSLDGHIRQSLRMVLARRYPYGAHLQRHKNKADHVFDHLWFLCSSSKADRENL